MRAKDAVRVDRAQRRLVTAMREQKSAASRFSFAREEKRRAEAEFVIAIESSKATPRSGR